MEEPAFLPVGTEVSAKYRGAFCEARVKKVVKYVKCKVTPKEYGPSLVVSDAEIQAGVLKLGATVEVKHPDNGTVFAAIINKLTDHSTYTVVFDDGDENTLRRTQLCLKGDKHFQQSETLDQLPLTHPEHFGTPVMKHMKGFKRGRTDSDSGEDMSDEDSDDASKKRQYVSRIQELVGRVVCFEVEDRKRTLWVPALVVNPNADETQLKTKDHLLVRSFRDSKFYAVHKKDIKDFTKETASKNEDKILKASFEKALHYYLSKELPSSWDREELLADTEEDDDPSDSEEEDSKAIEEKDRFVAQLYKFMDERNTPINKGPCIGNRDLDLFKLFRVVKNLGGYNKVTNKMKWKHVHSKMNLPPSNTASNQIKAAYKKYLHAFEDFDRKLGTSMGTLGGRPSRSRQNSGRSLLSFRERESPRSPRSDSGKETKKEEKVRDESVEEKVEKEEPETPRKTRTRSAVEKPEPDSRRSLRRDDSVDGSVKKEEEPVKHIKPERPKKLETTPTLEEDEESATRKRILTRKKLSKPETPTTPKGSQTPRTEKKSAEKKVIPKKPKEEEKESNKSDAEASEEEKEEESRTPRASIHKDYPYGTKIKVKYGKGKTQKIYEAKVVEGPSTESNSGQIFVHYDGWNKRHDEWITRDKIVSIVEMGTCKKPLPVKVKTPSVTKLPLCKPGIKPLVKPQMKEREGGLGRGRLLGANRIRVVGGKTLGKPRSTRSSSLETKLSDGLPMFGLQKKKKSGRSSADVSDTQSHVSGSDVADAESIDEPKEEPVEATEPEIKVAPDSPKVKPKTPKNKVKEEIEEETEVVKEEPVAIEITEEPSPKPTTPVKEVEEETNKEEEVEEKVEAPPPTPRGRGRGRRRISECQEQDSDEPKEKKAKDSSPCKEIKAKRTPKKEVIPEEKNVKMETKTKNKPERKTKKAMEVKVDSGADASEVDKNEKKKTKKKVKGKRSQKEEGGSESESDVPHLLPEVAIPPHPEAEEPSVKAAEPGETTPEACSTSHPPLLTAVSPLEAEPSPKQIEPPSSSEVQKEEEIPEVPDICLPDTPEHSPAAHQQVSPSSCDEAASTKSEHEANVEVEQLMSASPAGGESPNACDMSTISNGSGGSSGNAPSSEESGEGGSSKRKVEEEKAQTPTPPPPKRRKRGPKKGTNNQDKPKGNKQSTSDSEEEQGSPVKKADSSRPSKYNFNLDEGKYLEGEERISFLMDKLNEIRKIYMNLKSEVATIDRRRKRHRRKEREAAQAMVTQLGLSR